MEDFMYTYENEKFDYQKYWYFYDEGKFFSVPKTENIKDYEKKYFQKTPSNLFDYLFCNQKCPFKEKHFYFFAIRTDFIHSQQISNIITFFQELLKVSHHLILKGYIVFFYYEKKDFDFLDIIPSLNEDFNSNLVLFESGPIDRSQPEGFRILFDIYFQFYEKHPIRYLNNTLLIIELAKYQADQISKITSILLKTIIEDPSFLFLINALFENNLNITKTASSIYMHRNTINNKIEHIQKETGFYIQKFNDAMAVYILLKWK